MDNRELIRLLNRDIADEHAATLRYLIHAYLEGEDTAIGAPLLSRAREEMWHMHWLGMIIGQLGGEPNLEPAGYPYDSTNRATILRSYVEYEERLIPHYYDEAKQVDDPHIKRVLEREGWESDIHAKKFQRMLDKLSPQEAETAPGEENELPQDFLDRLQTEISNKYTEMLQHVRQAWVFQKEGLLSWQIMDQSMEKMKQLAHFAEDVAENGVNPAFESTGVDESNDLKEALKASLNTLTSARNRHQELRKDSEAKKHAGFIVNLDLTIQQEAYQIDEISQWLKK